jgi:hypothetical protein
MPMMHSLIPVRVSSVLGHTAVVLPGGSWVPDPLVEEALARGCALLGEAPVPVPNIVSEDRVAQLRAAIERVFDRGTPSEFTVVGEPRMSAIRREFGGPVSATEVAPILDTFPRREKVEDPPEPDVEPDPALLSLTDVSSEDAALMADAEPDDED